MKTPICISKLTTIRVIEDEDLLGCSHPLMGPIVPLSHAKTLE